MSDYNKKEHLIKVKAKNSSKSKTSPHRNITVDLLNKP